MVRFNTLVALVAVISLSVGVIWPSLAISAVAPQIESLGQVQEGLSVPGKIDIDAQGNLYVADADTGKVLKYDAAGTLMKTFAEVPVSGTALAVTAGGTRIYANVSGRVAVLNAQTGTLIGYLGALTSAGDIAVDTLGNVYVVDNANVQILKYDANGEFLLTIAGLGDGDGLFRRIDVMAVNAVAGELYVAGNGVSTGYSGRSIVQVFDLEGVFQSKIVDDAAFNGVVALCSGIAFGPDGLEFYLDQINANVRVRDRANGYLLTLNVKGVGPGLMAMPVDLVYDATSERLLVASDNIEIEVFGVNGGATPAINQAPTIPVPVSPIAGGEAMSVSPQLRFLNSSDANGDSISYIVELIDVATYTSVLVDGAESYAAVSATLDENRAYSWRVMARDARGVESAWSAEQTFFVNAANEPPTAPVLLTGAAGEELAGSGLLSWTTSTDPDPNDTITYQIEIAEDITFTEPTILAVQTGTESRLDTFIDYAALQDGIDYVWRVSADDANGAVTASAVGNFRYDTAMLTVSANLPDAEVFLGGNAAYAGNRLGVTPIEFRDMVPGAYTVVVERAGAEQFIAQVVIAGHDNTNIDAALDLAVVSSFKSSSDLRAGKSKLKVGMGAAPFAVDFNNDGMIDLLIGDDSGALTLFTALSQRGAKVQYDTGELLDVAPVAGAVPFVADWNNDNRKDLLVGAADGTVVLYLQKSYSSDLSPQFNSALLLQPEVLGSAAAPVVVDWDGNGAKDLLVGTADGRLLLFANESDDAQPQISADGQLINRYNESVAPMLVDWDADGERDLLLSNGGELNLYARVEGGGLSFVKTVFSTKVTLADEKVRFFVVDVDSEDGKDVFAGVSDGSVKLFRSSGRDFQLSVTAALLDKTAQLAELTKDEALLELIALIAAEIAADDLSSAGKSAKALLDAAPTSGTLQAAAVELVGHLSR